MSVDGDAQLDLLRDVIADLGLPLHRLSTRLTSLDEVFLDRAVGAGVVTTAAGQGAVYDRGYRPYEGPRGGRGRRRYALFKASIRRALGLRRSWRQKVAPFVLLGIVTIPAIINVGIGYVTRDQPIDRVELITYRDVRRRVLGPAAVRRPRGTRRRVPRPAPARAPADVRPPADRRRLRAAKVGAITAIMFAFSFIPQVVLFVGNMLVSDSALEYFKGHLDVLWQVPVAVALLAIYYAVIGVAIASLTDRRIVAGAAIIGLFLVTSISSGILVGDFERDNGSPAAVLNVLALPLYLRDLVFLGDDRPGLAADRRRLRRPARHRHVRRRPADRRRRAAVALPMGRAMSERASATRRSRQTPRWRSPTSRCGSGRRSPCPS